MTKIDITKKIVGVIVSISSSYVVTNVLKNNLTPTNPLEQAECVIGGVAIGMLVGNAAEKHINALIDRTAENWSDRQEAPDTV